MVNNSERPIKWAFFIMNRHLYALIFILLVIPLHVHAEDDLQTIINDAPEYSTIELEAKAYNGPVTITKPLTIKGKNGTIITSNTVGIDIIGTKNVIVDNIEFRTTLAPIMVTDSIQSTLENLTLFVLDEGIILRGGTDMTIRNVNITGLKNAHFSEKANGIESYDTDHIVVENSKATNLQDGFYFEGTSHVLMKDTQVMQGRYGMHFMYADHIILQNNVVKNNVTGFMLMVVQQLKLEQNIVQQQRELNSNGMYLYDIQEAEIVNNTFSENTIATVWKSVRSTRWTQNVFQMNGTAIESEKSPEVIVQGNQFVGNILSARSDQGGFVLHKNQYDDYAGNDFNGDGVGDTDYYAFKSFGQWMVRKPVYQYFIESPSVVVLNTMDKEMQTKNQQLLVDEQPVMIKANTGIQMNMDWWQFILGAAGISFVGMLRRKLK